MYNKRYPTIIRTGFKRPSKTSMYNKRRAIPTKLRGQVRYGGAYKRSNPVSLTPESKYADLTFVTNNTATSTTPANTTNGSTGAIPVAGEIMNLCNIPSAIGAQGSLLQIAQGTTKNNRIGNKLLLYQIRGKLTFLLNQEAIAGVPNDVVRFILYKDNQANGAAATTNEILDTAINGTVNIQSMQAMDFVDRITIIKDRYFTLNPLYGVEGASSGAVLLHMKFSHKCRAEIRYSSTTGAITEVQSDNYGIMLVSQNAATQVLSGQVRVYWKDH